MASNPPIAASPPIGADVPPITQPQPQQTLAGVEQPLPTFGQISQAAPIGRSDFQTLFNNLHANYYQPLNQQVQLTAPQIDDPTIQALANQILAAQQASAVGTGARPPDPASVLAKASSHLSAGEIAGKVGQETFQQMVMDPFHQFINTWQKDPKAGLLETLGGAALIGGIVGLSAIGAAPLIFAAGAALVAPGMISAWLDELQHPTDSNLVKALVNTSTGILTVGTPVKWNVGMGAMRAGFETGFKAFKDEIEPLGVARKWQTGTGSYQGLRNLPLGKQLDVLANRGKSLRQQLKRYGFSADGDAVELLQMQERLDGLITAASKAMENGDDEAAQGFLATVSELDHGTKEDPGYRELRLRFAYNHQFLPSKPFSHVPLFGRIKSDLIGPKQMQELQGHLDSTMGWLDEMASG